MIGTIVSHYRIVKELGRGGMGVVYCAEDMMLGRQVALKFLHEDKTDNYAAVERFEREARAAAAINHPNICTVHEIGTHEGLPYIAMELLEGSALKDRIDGTTISLEHALKWAVQITAGLDAAHRHSIIHRDLKPANLFITVEEEAKILDFGLAKLGTLTMPAAAGSLETTIAHAESITKPGMVVGTPRYISPEQVQGQDLDPRTDLFSLGVVLYEITTGINPFQGASAGTIVAAILRDVPDRPSRLNPAIPLRLEQVINKLLQKDPRLRYQTAADVHADLLTLTLAKAKSRLPAAGGAFRSPPAHIRSFRLAVIALVTALCLAGGLFWRSRLRPPTSPNVRVVAELNSKPGVAVVSPLPVPKPDGYLTDTVGVIDRESKRWLEEYARGLAHRYGSQLGIVVVDSLRGEPIESFAGRVFKAWSVGRTNKNDGVLLVLAIQDHTSRLQVGYGLEYLFTPETCTRILADMRPSLRKKEYGNALRDASLIIGSIFNGAPLH